MNQKKQNQLERNKEILRQIKLAYKIDKPVTLSTDNIKNQNSNKWQTKNKIS